MEAAEKIDENRIDVKTRKIQKMGNSLYVALPLSFTKRLDLKKGEEVVVVSRGDTVRVMPIKES